MANIASPRRLMAGGHRSAQRLAEQGEHTIEAGAGSARYVEDFAGSALGICSAQIRSDHVVNEAEVRVIGSPSP